jgi:Na+/H+ antiporter NhaD/arsenite permease-like protein
MLKLPIRETIFLCISLLLFVFGLTELGILADLNRIYHSLPDEAKSNSGVAITVVGALAIATGFMCMLYAGILTQEVWIKPRPCDAQVRLICSSFRVILINML